VNVAVIGCGVRGAVAAALLAGAGVEELSLVDGVLVEEADIGRHPLQFTPDLRAGKADALAAKIGLINPACHAQPFPADVDEQNAVAILTGAACALDCAGDPATSQRIEAAADEIGIPVVAAPAGYAPDEVTSAVAVAIGALQADLVLALRDAGPDSPTAGVIRADGAAIN
jgi:adenylyltransferase/sulfurtransferase